MQTGSINFAETRESFGDKELQDKFYLLVQDLESFKNQFAKWTKEFQDSLN